MPYYPLISVIIPTYNYARFLAEAINSVISQTYSNIEIIVVDDDSTDNTNEVLAAYGNQIRVIKQANGGAGAARNNGVKNSTGELIAFLDADDIWHPTKLERQIALFEKDLDLGLVHCGMREFDANGQTVSIHLNGQSGWRAREILLIGEVVVGPGSTALVRRSIFEKIGGFNEDRRMYAEDWEFCYRIATVSKIEFIAEILVEYRNHGKNKHFDIPRMEQSVKLLYEDVFTNSLKKELNFRLECYGNFHTMLAGSYFKERKYSDFIKHTIKSLWYSPIKISRYLGFPARLWNRHRRSGKATVN